MLRLSNEHHEIYCKWLIDHACKGKTGHQKAQLREFYAKLSASLIALVSGQVALVSRKVTPQTLLLVKLMELALGFIPLTGQFAGKALNALPAKPSHLKKRI